MSVSIKVVFYDPDNGGVGPDGDLICYEGLTPGTRIYDVAGEGLQAVAMFLQRPNGQGGFFTDIYTGNSLWEAVESATGMAAKVHNSGAGGQTLVKSYKDVDETSKPIRAVDSKIELGYIGGSAWDVLDGGNSAFYDIKAQQAIDLVLGG